MTGSQIDPNIVSQDVTPFIATGVIAYPQQDLAAGSSTARPGASPTWPAPEERRAIGHIRRTGRLQLATISRETLDSRARTRAYS
jgi:hypothetical protein